MNVHTITAELAAMRYQLRCVQRSIALTHSLDEDRLHAGILPRLELARPSYAREVLKVRRFVLEQGIALLEHKLEAPGPLPATTCRGKACCEACAHNGPLPGHSACASLSELEVSLMDIGVAGVSYDNGMWVFHGPDCLCE